MMLHLLILFSLATPLKIEILFQQPNLTDTKTAAACEIATLIDFNHKQPALGSVFRCWMCG
jgi:hypothetical protein